MSDGVSSGDRQLLADLREHAQLLASGLRGGLRRVKVLSGDVAVEVEWQVSTGDDRPAGPSPAAAAPAHDQSPEPGGDGLRPGLLAVNSPMVGTFYRAPEPGAAPFVDVGDTVEPGQTVAIVEAMKLMNPVTAETGGCVAEILVADAEPVEFDQPLIAFEAAQPT